MNTSAPGRFGGPNPGLRIGEVATVARLSVRAIRHYHARGLLPEPPRDTSGYRRYGPDELVALVRIGRLRALGMPLEQIAAVLDTAPAGATAGGLREALTALAQDMTQEIERLAGLRDQLLALAGAEPDDPAAAFASALRSHGLLPATGVPPKERRALGLVDALHPGGIQGAIADAEPLLADPARRAVLTAALQRFASVDDGQVEALAHDLAAALPLPSHPVTPVDPEVMAELAGAHLSPAQRRCLARVRELLERRSRESQGLSSPEGPS